VCCGGDDLGSITCRKGTTCVFETGGDVTCPEAANASVAPVAQGTSGGSAPSGTGIGNSASGAGSMKVMAWVSALGAAVGAAFL
jgi:hypothetical protein